MTRAIVLGSVAVLTLGFTWPPEYAEQSRADVATCVSYARQSSPRFDARVRDVDLATGRVDIQRSADDARGEVAFATCLLAVRQYRLIERNLPDPTDPGPADPAASAERARRSFVR
ncbi:MAG TPA: hypothetical protein VFT36_11705 [Methylomirabilota bacterium]|nr:hypothetical protein [Methylomirabilota bacterium]